jgi:hypothetical protein
VEEFEVRSEVIDIGPLEDPFGLPEELVIEVV